MILGVLEKKMSVLEDEASAIVLEDLPFERVLWSVEDVSAAFMVPSLDARNITFNNGGGDFFITKFSYDAWWTNAEGGSFRLRDCGCGMMVPDATFNSYRGFFDFSWNMKRGSSQASYLLPGMTDGQLVSRRAFGNMERGNFMEVAGTGWKIPMGDRLMFTIKPLGYRAIDGPAIAGSRFVVNIHMHGYRTGMQ